jgi:thiamine biosynthesis protein ThiS
MDLTINGEAKTLNHDSLTVIELLDTLGLGGRRVAVEQNRIIIPRARHAFTPVSEGDVIEIVSFVGGG